MVNGAAGSIGSELCRQLLKYNVKQLLCLDNAETPLHNLPLEVGNNGKDIKFVLADIRKK